MSAKILRVLALLMMMLAASQCFASTPMECINDFAFSAGRILGASSESYFFSPYSIISAFGMAYLGAGGVTAREIESVLKVSPDIHSSLGELTARLADNGDVLSANRVWLRTGLTLRDEYTSNLLTSYNSHIRQLDFKGKTKAAIRTINDWVSTHTNGRITDLLSSIDPDTQMILTNAVYFNAEWLHKFPKRRTATGKFHRDDKSTVDVSMMKQIDDFDYGEVDGVKLVKLPYRGRRVSMLAALPRLGQDITLSSELFAEWLKSLSEYEVDLWLPKFKAENSYELQDLFKSLGMELAFSNQADFSGITDDVRLKIDEIIHKTFVEIDEERTEAAAATGMYMMLGTAMPAEKRRAEFHADRPFMYFILDNETDTILFMGRQTF